LLSTKLQSNKTVLASLKQLKCVDFICKRNSLFPELENDSTNNSIYETLLSESEDARAFLSSELEITDEEIEEVRHIVG